MSHKHLLGSLILLSLLAGATAQAGDMPEYKLVTGNQQFAPSTLRVSAQIEFKVLATNQDWNISWLLGNDSLFGQALYVLVGYEARQACSWCSGPSIAGYC